MIRAWFVRTLKAVTVVIVNHTTERMEKSVKVAVYVYFLLIKYAMAITLGNLDLDFQIRISDFPIKRGQVAAEL